MSNIIFVGQLFAGSSAHGRLVALAGQGHVRSLDLFPPEGALVRPLRWARRRWGIGLQHPVNAQLVRAATEEAPDLVWVDKGLYIAPAALACVKALAPKAKLVHYSLDDHAIRANVSADLLSSLGLYDLVVTTKSFNVELLKSWGSRRVMMSWQGYDATLHRPPEAKDRQLEERIVFIGAWERARAQTIAALLASGLPVTVVSHWREWRDLAQQYSNLDWRTQDVYDQGYAKTLGSGAVALGFLRKMARDQHTQRSVEIPACGGVMLAERTEEHLALFEEGTEAEFFSSDEECVSKAKALLSDPVRRAEVARRGLLRCREGGYSWEHRVAQIIDALGEQAA